MSAPTLSPEANTIGAAAELAPARGQSRLGALLALALYAVAVGAFFWQPLFLPGVVVPKGGGDLASFLYPAYSFAAEQLQRGVFPLWNPYLYSGTPFAADVQSGLYYPPNLLAFLFARPFTYQALEVLAAFHYLLAAFFGYLYGRTLRLSWPASFAVGLIYAFGGFSVAHLAHYNMLAAAAWLPLVLLLFHRAVERPSLAWAAATGSAFGVAILAGHTQISLYTAFFLGLYWLWALASHRAKSHVAGRSPFPGRRLVATLPLCFLVAGGLAAVQLVPLAELLRLSLRSDLSYANAVAFAASPMGLITLLVPHFFGDNPSDYWGVRWNLAEVYGYAGILTWALAAIALWVVRPWRRWTAFFAFAALLALLLSLGEQTVLHGWLYRFVPGFDKVRAAGRFLMAFDLFLAVLAGHGLDVLTRPLRARYRPAYRSLVRLIGLALGGAVFLGAPILYYALLTSQDKDAAIFRRVSIALDSFNLSVLFLALSLALLVAYRRGAFHLRRPGLPALAFLPYLALALVALDLFSANAPLNPVAADVLEGYDHPGIVSFLRDQPEPGRIDSATGAADLWQPNSGQLHALPDVLGLFNPMTLAGYQRYWESLGSRSVPGYDLLNAAFVVGRKDVELDRAKFTVAFDGDPALNVFRNSAALPRAFVVSRAEALPREDQLARLRTPGFDPRQAVLLDPDVNVATLDGGGKVTAFRYPSPNEVLVALDSPRSGYLVLSEVYYPGWQAYVDGQAAPVLRANYTFRAIALPAGAREVRLVFTPRSWQVGLAITLATCATLLILAALAAKRRDRIHIGDQV